MVGGVRTASPAPVATPQVHLGSTGPRRLAGPVIFAVSGRLCHLPWKQRPLGCYFIATRPAAYYHHGIRPLIHLTPGGKAVDKGNLSRRGFLQRTLTGMLGAGLPLWYARAALAERAEEAAVRDKKIGPNDTIQVGVIGSGDRFKGGLFGDVKRHKAFRIVACCDVDKKHVNTVADMAQKEYKNE